ncbi:hypothetical protein NFG81_02925 [Bacillus paralicheniformis]|uniref:hypothetical protein n=1 Tax=Bacillus paralicheniformis TaxID=1648923 RepID=UPI0011AA7A9E|nr:hypothetical protein [Bacillus paralicheniformis]KAA0836961.1 hypothetical protein EI977_12870 [Bacillus paralicheniformis]KAA0843053.1 hypothetical protein EI979_05665 [Bacillus paralicheniformis]MBZ5215688.1 hypothetical protein [Bacillus paralicheniformis]MCQ5454300.1 hypothetical protein [Bacillus paralicheniformis]UAY69149.1 hypothetical protein K8336_14500 [Bacillus paralicheniformis]
MKKIFVSLALAFVLSFSFYSSSKAAVLARVAVYPGEVRQSADIFHGVGEGNFRCRFYNATRLGGGTCSLYEITPDGRNKLVASSSVDYSLQQEIQTVYTDPVNLYYIKGKNSALSGTRTLIISEFSN